VKILLVEDDPGNAYYMFHGLTAEGHDVSVDTDGLDAFEKCVSQHWDLVILDRLLPRLDGLSMMRRMRTAGINIPVLFVTGLSDTDDIVEALYAGGDDYLVKPFKLSELSARVAALGRRSQWAKPGTTLSVADLELDLVDRTVRRAGRLIDLQTREFQILEYLMRHAGEVVTRKMLLENVWGLGFEPGTNIIESTISRLRTKIGGDGTSELIQTIRGAGYRLEIS
jgi:two-component system OmpR family response regulator